ncbi:adh1 [Symbiodinium microadriaticum]|nr:adh1 [Symbiodinium microadriaticum]
MLLGSMYAGMAFANAPVGAVHALAYPIGSHFHVPHGLSNSLVLPHVIRFNAAPDVASTASCAAMYADLADITFQGDLSSTRDVFEKSEEFASLFEKLAAELTIAGKLREVGIEENDITLLAREAMNQTRLLPNNARDMCHEDALEIYRKAF